MELASTHIQRNHIHRAVIEEDLCESPCRRANVDGPPTPHFDRESIESRQEFVGAA
jgi:hypothetical protein